MAYFAKITEDNEVLTVLNLADTDMQDSNGVEREYLGQNYLQTNNNWPAEQWIQTSYNTRANKHYTDNVLSEDQSKAFRGNLAVPGGTWDPDNNIFWNPLPSSNWIKHIPTASWVPPVGPAPELTDEQKNDSDNRYMYKWSEENQAWELLIADATVDPHA